MTESINAITVADTVRWLHDDGLKRLAAVGGRVAHPIAAYTVDVATGAVTAHPATGEGRGSDAMTLAADDLPLADGTPGRLVVVGVTPAEAVLAIDLATTLAIAINGRDPDAPARSWVMQLLLNADLTLTTNGAATAIGASGRYRYRFTPGVTATTLTVDDRRTPITTISLNPEASGPDHLDLTEDGGELYLGARFWKLRQVLGIDDATWSALEDTLDAPPTMDQQADGATAIGGDS